MTARAVVTFIGTWALVGAPTSGSAEDGSIADEISLLLAVPGLLGLAAIGLFGVALVLAWRRRDQRPEPETEAADALRRRTIRRARMRLPDDPIVDALGIDPDGKARHRPAVSRQAGRGVGDRPARQRRR